MAVFVPPEREELALVQLAAYDREQRQEAEAVRRAPPPPPEVMGPVWPGLLVMAVVLGGVHGWKVSMARDLARSWSRDGVEIFVDGEWWRAATALLVHADMAHLLGNLSFGLLLMWFVVRAFGRWLGWWWVGWAGVLGNVAVAAFFYPERWAGVGASTAVFAAVGLLVAHGMIWSHGGQGLRRHRSWLVPFGGGLGLLGVFGSGGDGLNVDVGAHLAGFVAGMGVGMPVAWWQRWCRVRERPVRQAAVS
jgi:membrane associated rhomboid family serine protease